MKRYSKPLLKTVETDSIHETVFMGTSGWYGQGCFTASYTLTQNPADGFGKVCYHVDAKHDPVAYGLPSHTSHNQYVILTFDEPIPEGAVPNCNCTGVTISNTDIDPTRTRIRFLTDYWQNETDKIGFSDLYLTFTFTSEADLGGLTYNEWVKANVKPSTDIDAVQVYDLDFLL